MGRRAVKKGASSLGRALLKDRFDRQRRPDEFSHNHTTELDDGAKWTRYQSVTEQRDLDEFLSTAELAGTDFTAERRNVKVVVDVDTANSGRLTAEQEARVTRLMREHTDQLRIPRRPRWDNTMTAQDLQQRERDAFLDWRRSLAQLQEQEELLMTPFERNIEVWRQLWRVVERCDLLVQIVDARNPLLFRCTDLETYVREVGASKKNLLLINKADLLSEEQRKTWAEYFNREKIPFVFWSAFLAQHQLDEEAAAALAADAADTERRLAVDPISGKSLQSLMPQDGRRPGRKDEDEADARWEATRIKLEDLELVEDDVDGAADVELDDDEDDADEGGEAADDMEPVEDDGDEEYEDIDSDEDDAAESEANGASGRRTALAAMGKADIISRSDLFKLFLALSPPVDLLEDGSRARATIGFVGYPNVGKSSTINVLCGEKRVAVAATPGKTKHFQTLNVGEDLCLCDCPGLVFPNFATTKAELVCNGILPVDQLRDGVAPVGLICDRLPRRLLELIYGVRLAPPADDENPKRKPTASELLSAYAYMRGFVKSNHGTADEQRAARYILKDMVNGKLLFCQPPPGIAASRFNNDQYRQQIRKYSILRGRVDAQAAVSPPAPAGDATGRRTAPAVAAAEADEDMDAPLPASRAAVQYSAQGPVSASSVSEIDREFFKQSKVLIKSKGKNPIEDFRKAQHRALTQQKRSEKGKAAAS